MTVTVTAFGAPAFEALRGALQHVRGNDPLAAVDVAVPSAFVGVTTRRRLATPGLAGVRFAPLPRLIAERATPVLAASGRHPLADTHRRALTRAALTAATGPLTDSARRSGNTVDVVTGVFAELDDAAVDEQMLAALADAGRWPREVAAVYRRYVELRQDVAAPADLAEAAAKNPSDVPLIVYLPRRLTPVELAFCRRLRERGLLHAVVALTGEPRADADAVAIISGLDLTATVPACPTRAPAHVQALPDAEEEARYAVRRIFAHLAEHGTRIDRIGAAYRTSVPYARLITEQLSAARLPHHAPRQRTLAQTVPGRTLLGLLRLPGDEWSRTAVLDWIRGGPVGDRGRWLPVSSWQRQAGEAGVTRGPVTQWQQKLERLAGRLEATPVDVGATWPAERATDTRALAAFVVDAARRVEGIASAESWSAAAPHLQAALEHYLGGAHAAARWGGHPDAVDDREVRARCDVERTAYEQTKAVLHELRGLDDGGVAFGFDALLDVLTEELDASVHEATGTGRGVLVGPTWDLAGADLDLLIVVGAAAGVYPPSGREHPLVRDVVRTRLGLRTLEDRRAADRRDHLALLASAPDVVLTHPVADMRTQRGAEPAPWLLEQTSPRLSAKQQKQTAPSSFQSALCSDRLPAASISEYDVRNAMTAAPLSPQHPLAAADPTLARGLDALRARVAGEFGQWTGGLSHPVPDAVTAKLNRTLSASSLQTYASCPFSYYLDNVLRVRALEEPDGEQVDAAERGTAVHDVLERIVGAAIAGDKPAGEPWSDAEHADAQRMLGEQAERMLAEGKAGRPTVWAVQVERWRRQLRQMLLADDDYRARTHARPRAVEHRFGGEDPLTVDLPSGPVQLAGSIDRVDVTSDGDVVVLDYKTGRSRSYDSFPREGEPADDDTDLTARGKRLQLPLYALAARRDFADPTSRVSGYYWFVDEGDVRRGGVIDDAALDRFRDVVDIAVAGIRDGAFPLRPGEFDPFFRSFDSCRYCEFTRTCSDSRDDLWAGMRNDSRVQRYAQMAEPDGSEQS